MDVFAFFGILAFCSRFVMLTIWRNCNLGVKLRAAFVLVMVIFGAALGGVLVQNAKVQVLVTRLSTTIVPARAMANRLAIYITTADDAGAYYVAEHRPAQGALRLASYRQAVVDFKTTLAQAEQLADNDVQRALIADIHAVADGPKGYFAGNEDAIALRAAGKFEAATKSYFNEPPDEIVAAANRYRDDTRAQSDASIAEIQSLQASSKTLGIALGCFAALLGILVATLISRSISGAVRATTLAISGIVTEDIAALALALGRLSGGDLTARFASTRTPLNVNGTDEIGELVRTYNTLAAALTEIAQRYTAATRKLSGLISIVAVTSKSLADSSSEASAAATQSAKTVGQIADAIDVVATGTTDQASKIADTATAIEELSRTAEQIAHVATNQAETIAATTAALQKLDTGIGALSSQGAMLTTAAREASSETLAGNAAVEETAGTISQLKAVSTAAAGAMSSLEERSSQVEEIVDTIEDIADQTNLLALNAAIEAARAGEHGRGFAVVADEVRKLAERSSTATKEISKILGGIKRETVAAADAMRSSADSMESGITVSQRASRALESVGRAIGTTTTVAETLAGQAHEMQDASTRVTESMFSASAAVEENAAAAAEMRNTTDHVTSIIVPIAATASANAQTAKSVAISTQQLAAGIGEIEETARTLQDKAADLDALIKQFTVDDAIQVRKYLRLDIQLETKYALAGKAVAKGRTRDIGGGGICFESDQPLAAATPLTVWFQLPNKIAVEAAGRIVGSHFDEGAHVHVHHVSFSQADKDNAISSYIIDARRRALTAHGPGPVSGPRYEDIKVMG
jgi:methyl-accepting chemotaxis protein